MLLQLDYSEADHIWFTGDHHFGHENIIKYCDRPFKDVTQMDETLIYAWNARIGPADIVFHLGDLTLGDKTSAEYYLSNLNGYIHVLSNEWHHDKRWLGDDNEHYSYRSSRSQYKVEFLPGLVVLELQNFGNGKFPLAITLCHYPMAEWDRKHYGAWHLHGHTHNQYHVDGFILDVGVDAHSYYPINLSDIYEIMCRK